MAYNKFTLFFIVVFIFITCGLSNVSAQLQNDLELIKDHTISKAYQHEHLVKFGLTKKQNFFAKYNPVYLAFSSLMYGYQKWLSPQISSNCYYEPSCSVYSKMLFQEYGAVKGLVSSMDRLMRCDRISATTFYPGSIDPVDHKIHEDLNRYRFKQDDSE